ncbi:hypothetical protein EalM132_00127 [Exiguobacterium phage vB_EalM-132]|nr:hypothetical protein EalM132_00127 [Exiguobacterium phage vB_EalM-132]
MAKLFYEVEPIQLFKNEIECIKNPLHKVVVETALELAPDYYYFVPASSSGKYHPISSLGMHGLVRHVKSVFWIGQDLLSHPTLYNNFTDDEKDDIRVAILLHDTCKQGVSDEGSHTVMEHPLLVREQLKPYDDTALEEDAPKHIKDIVLLWDRVCTLIETHMGPWVTDKKSGKDILEPPTSPGQLFVHMCDYLASRNHINVDTTDRDSQSGSGGSGKSDSQWRNEPATDKQINYAKKLMQKLAMLNVESPVKEIKVTDGMVSVSTLKHKLVKILRS